MQTEPPEAGPEGNDLANTSVVFDADGGVVATYRKIHRFGFGSGEPRLMEAGTGVVVTPLPAGGGRTVPTGISTCYDLRFPELYRRQVEAGGEIITLGARKGDAFDACAHGTTVPATAQTESLPGRIEP